MCITGDTENSWTHVDSQKVNQNKPTIYTAAEDLDDTVVVGDVDVSRPESVQPNAARQYPGWTDTAGEIPQPISPPTQPPYQPQRPPTPKPPAPPVSPPGCLAPRGQFPSPNNCANYLNCWDEIVIEQQCPNQLLFNDRTGLCDFEDNVNCGSRPGPTPSKFFIDLKIQTRCELHDSCGRIRTRDFDPCGIFRPEFRWHF